MNNQLVKLYAILANNKPVVNDEGLITTHPESIALGMVTILEINNVDTVYSLEYCQSVEVNGDVEPIGYIDTWNDLSDSGRTAIYCVYKNGKPLRLDGISYGLKRHKAIDLVNHLQAVNQNDNFSVSLSCYTNIPNTKPTETPLYALYQSNKPLVQFITTPLLRGGVFDHENATITPSLHDEKTIEVFKNHIEQETDCEIKIILIG